ncbi:MAG TPA: Sec-independent protein translocase subunit TatB [Propionibacterium sp.]|jgi:sec-independent protein translocase protein TatB|nr:Sec-independent protein translocase subunit TatB [Propionibacterium sp.]
MFDVGPAEITVLAVLAVIIFGPERLPELARKAARIVRFLRGIANNAQESLSRELGTEVDLSNPKAFVKSYLLNDIQPVIDDVKKDLQEVENEVRAEFAQVRGNLEALDQARPAAVADAVRAGAPFDPEAT